jgi:predicted short-subunit dehydrogenase-like oxidoreductase (DUF2520 family)
VSLPSSRLLPAHDRAVPPHVAVMGAGRLGRSLAAMLPPRGVRVTLVRRGEGVPDDADAVWLCVRDAELPGLAAALAPVEATRGASRPVLHASGALGAEVLAPIACRGVLHPLMSFPGPEVGLPDLSGAGARVEGHPRAVVMARTLAGVLGLRVVEGIDPTRWHAAACLASGHLAAAFLTAAEVLEGAGLDAESARAALGPLARESLRRAVESGDTALTGPAVRGDVTTEERHRAALGDADRAVYDVLARRIRALTAR